MGEFDEWIVLGDEHYSNPGIWLPVDDDESKARYRRENRLLLADSYLDLLRGTTPIAVNVRRGEQAAYLVAEYAAVTQAWPGMYEDPISPREARTSIWIDLAYGLFRRAEGRFVLPLHQRDGGEVIETFKHGFASYSGHRHRGTRTRGRARRR